jgi:hypothetical protein
MSVNPLRDSPLSFAMLAGLYAALHVNIKRFIRATLPFEAADLISL